MNGEATRVAGASELMACSRHAKPLFDGWLWNFRECKETNGLSCCGERSRRWRKEEEESEVNGTERQWRRERAGRERVVVRKTRENGGWKEATKVDGWKENVILICLFFNFWN